MWSWVSTTVCVLSSPEQLSVYVPAKGSHTHTGSEMVYVARCNTTNNMRHGMQYHVASNEHSCLTSCPPETLQTGKPQEVHAPLLLLTNRCKMDNMWYAIRLLL